MSVTDLKEEIKIVLKDYEEEVQESVEESVEKVAKDAVKELKKYKNFAPGSKRGQRYHKKWTHEIKKGRMYVEATIYNKMPGLPHLLEHGHSIQNGTGKTHGRVQGYPHISKVEEQVEKEVERLIRKKVEG